MNLLGRHRWTLRAEPLDGELFGNIDEARGPEHHAPETLLNASKYGRRFAHRNGSNGAHATGARYRCTAPRLIQTEGRSMLNEIRTQLDGLINQGQLVTGESVKAAICRACRDFDPLLQPYATGVGDDVAEGNEWLYDVTCLRYDDDGFLTRVALTAECEWGVQNQVYYDFEKLLLARADLRVMVFDGTRAPGYTEFFGIFSQYIGRCAHSVVGDQWLFVAWTPEQFAYYRVAAFENAGALD